MAVKVIDRPVPVKTQERAEIYVEKGKVEKLDRLLATVSQERTEDAMEVFIRELWTQNYLIYIDAEDEPDSPDRSPQIMRTLWKYSNPDSGEYQFY